MTKAVLLKTIIKIMFILALVAFLTWKAVICLQHYLQNPSYTTNRYVNQDKTEFPAITICPAMSLGYTRFTKETFVRDKNTQKLETTYLIQFFSLNMNMDLLS